VSPTRMMLLQLLRRLALARRGHKLLKDKLDGLVQRFLTIKKEYLELYLELEPRLIQLFNKSIFSFALSSPKVFQNNNKPSLSLAVTRQNIMGVKIPSYQLTRKGEPAVSPLLATIEFSELLVEFNQILPDLLKLSARNKSLRLIAEQIIETRRRVNALEYVLIPELKRNVSLIRMKLSELERASKVILLKR
ncbi:MAG: V-type ATP synthase subunit D, partial [Candidatus Margulisiibacteriota bacterium]